MAENIRDFVGKVQKRMTSISAATTSRVLTINNVLDTRISGYRGMHAHQMYKYKGVLQNLHTVGGINTGNSVGE